MLCFWWLILVQFSVETVILKNSSHIFFTITQLHKENESIVATTTITTNFICMTMQRPRLTKPSWFGKLQNNTSSCCFFVFLFFLFSVSSSWLVTSLWWWWWWRTEDETGAVTVVALKTSGERCGEVVIVNDFGFDPPIRKQRYSSALKLQFKK